MSPFSPTQLVWTERDFDQMSWHDCRLHGIGFVDDFDPHLHELRLDIDYIMKWCHSTTPGEEDGFWIAPATLVFDAYDCQVDVPGLGGTWILDIVRQTAGAGKPVRWTVRLNTGGVISLEADGFRQYARQPPTFVPTPNQYLETNERGPISFHIPTGEL